MHIDVAGLPYLSAAHLVVVGHLPLDGRVQLQVAAWGQVRRTSDGLTNEV